MLFRFVNITLLSCLRKWCHTQYTVWRNHHSLLRRIRQHKSKRYKRRAHNKNIQKQRTRK